MSTPLGENLVEEILAPDVIKGLNAIIGRLDAVNANLSNVAKALGVNPVTLPGAGVPSSSLMLPFDPETLSRLLVFARFLGVSTATELSVSLAVPGDGTPVIFTYNPPPGYVLLFVGKALVSTTYASNLLTLDISIDGNDITPPPNEYALVNATQFVSLGQWYYLQRALKLTNTNNTGVTAQVSMQGSVILVDSRFFQKVYLPLVKLDIEAMQSLVSAEAS